MAAKQKLEELKGQVPKEAKDAADKEHPQPCKPCCRGSSIQGMASHGTGS